MIWPIAFSEVIAAEARLRPHLAPTALRAYPSLDAAVGHGLRVLVKHENHLPTNAFKVRNALSVLTAMGEEARRRGELTFPALREGLAGFVTVSEAEIAEAIRLLLRATHNLAEGAGAASLAGLRKLAPELSGKTVVVVLSESNIDRETLRRVVSGEL